jgi:DmsE family decaheme c-type cytochrome
LPESGHSLLRLCRHRMCGLLGAALLTLIATASMAQAPGRQGAPQTYAPGGVLSCLNCHNQAPTNAVLGTAHGSRADTRGPFNDNDCETCHGPSSEHRRSRALPVSIQFEGGRAAWTAASVDTQNSVCLGCHENGLRTHWYSSEHQLADLACVSCHDIHTRRDPVLQPLLQADVCIDCHLEKRAQFSLRSHHPVREGLMTCSACHNPHGSGGERLLALDNVIDTCANCHAEKRGPFLWEHQPVSDDCTNCHNPHGSVTERLLVQRPPFLCQNCHQNAFHPSTLYSGDDVPPIGTAQQLLGQACLNCHSQVHGSNHPSGARLTR